MFIPLSVQVMLLNTAPALHASEAAFKRNRLFKNKMLISEEPCSRHMFSLIGPPLEALTVARCTSIMLY